MVNEYQVEILQEIVNAEKYNEIKTPAELAPVIDLAKATIRYSRYEQESFRLIKDLNEQMRKEKEYLKACMEKKEASFKALESVLPEEHTLNSLYKSIKKEA